MKSNMEFRTKSSKNVSFKGIKKSHKLVCHKVSRDSKAKSKKYLKNYDAWKLLKLFELFKTKLVFFLNLEILIRLECFKMFCIQMVKCIFTQNFILL